MAAIHNSVASSALLLLLPINKDASLSDCLLNKDDHCGEASLHSIFQVFFSGFVEP
jgi:hypothetical protein